MEQKIMYRTDMKGIALGGKVKLTGEVIAVGGSSKSKDLTLQVKITEFEKVYDK